MSTSSKKLLSIAGVDQVAAAADTARSPTPNGGKDMAETFDFRLPLKLDFRSATSVKSVLDANVDRHIRLDASEVKMLGTHCLQVFLAARKHWANRGLRFEFGAASDPFHKALATFGFTPGDLGIKETSNVG